jgi:hypothetical protein
MAKATKATKKTPKTKSEAKAERRGRPSGVPNYHAPAPIAVRDTLINRNGEKVGIRVYCQPEHVQALETLATMIESGSIFKTLGVKKAKATA